MAIQITDVVQIRAGFSFVLHCYLHNNNLKERPMSDDQKFKDLIAQLQALKNQNEYLLDLNKDRKSEIDGLHLLISALARSHQDKPAFQKKLSAAHQAWLANVGPSPLSDREIALSTKLVEPYLAD